jgi:DNA-binding NarL/FixJ family response regulator
MSPVRVLIIDDHSMVRQGLRLFLSVDEEIEIVGEAADGEQGCELARSLQPDVVLMDILMPGMNGVQATSIIHRELPEIEVIALTSALEEDLVSNAIQAGAMGYLLKDTEAKDLRQAIKAAAAGQLVLSPKAAARLMRDVKTPTVSAVLSERERQVLELMARGCSNKDIGQTLHISQPTVKSHVSNILGKLGVTTRTQAVVSALRMDLVTLEVPTLESELR